MDASSLTVNEKQQHAAAAAPARCTLLWHRVVHGLGVAFMRRNTSPVEGWVVCTPGLVGGQCWHHRGTACLIREQNWLARGRRQGWVGHGLGHRRGAAKSAAWLTVPTLSPPPVAEPAASQLLRTWAWEAPAGAENGCIVQRSVDSWVCRCQLPPRSPQLSARDVTACRASGQKLLIGGSSKFYCPTIYTTRCDIS